MLKEKRKQKGYKQKEIAKAIGVSQQLISKWESRKQEMPIRHAKKISELLGCNWKDLYED